MADDNIEHDVSDAACKLGIIMQSSYYFMENILRNMSGENVRRLQRVCKNFYLFCEKFRYDNCETLVIWRKRKDTYDWSWSDCDVEGVKDFLKEYSAIPRFIFLFSETTDLSNDLNSILHSSSSFFCGLTENKFKYRNLCRRGRAYFNALKAGINGFILPYGLLNRMDVCIRTKAFT
ncbi:unnamed protein product [Dracunculus medinensis]|uniref:F-box domain-containing protein n=1 Tax=Dracunculus medinensis TaxID=318479 RepID=A0A0N4U8L7_DRAME|nr:unnamed protein product [Dracunculus medinensis]